MGSSKTWVQSRSGLKVDLLNPDPEAIRIEDIAHALAHICRYTGHTERFYSVAEHSVRVSWRAADLAWAAGNRCNAFEIARWGLLHDATEAYLGDVSRPLKYLAGMQPYRDLEKVWAKVIAARFGLVGEQPPEVSQADDELLGTEAAALMTPVHPDWGQTCPGGKLPDPLPDMHNLGWDPYEARQAFLDRYTLLFGGGK